MNKVTAAEAFATYRAAVELCRSTFARNESIVGEYGEHLAAQALGGTLAPVSNKGIDLVFDGVTYQVKTRCGNPQSGAIIVGFRLPDRHPPDARRHPRSGCTDPGRRLPPVY